MILFPRESTRVSLYGRKIIYEDIQFTQLNQYQRRKGSNCNTGEVCKILRVGCVIFRSGSIFVSCPCGRAKLVVSWPFDAHSFVVCGQSPNPHHPMESSPCALAVDLAAGALAPWIRFPLVLL